LFFWHRFLRILKNQTRERVILFYHALPEPVNYWYGFPYFKILQVPDWYDCPKIFTWVGRTARALTLGTILVLRDWMMGRTQARVLPG
jgi:hypothetical protein